MVHAIPPRPEALLFDLDGTLTDPKPGITRSVQYALERLGLTPPPADDLEWVIGPPLAQSFAVLLGPGGDPAEGVRLYRERYAVTGLFENEIVPGIPALLDDLLADGRRLFVATSKPRVFAERILDHFGLADRFQHVHGSELDGTRADKRDLIAYAVAQERLTPAATVMIGDREHDVIGAGSVGIGTIGVRWGYGSDAELMAAGVAALVDRPAEIGRLAGLPEARAALA
ncbi:HAD hydrolase-like protein [Alsobacter sp. SYSU M60028]|uniref:HAD hydrolase-like protein n=1 Tax=Alsobacter ponti TaxID=2962936 RepID=A0ABT1LG90_9HYPH|nr:HAD hydrolase-like protein [Alsobacter ponti]MCP8940512.1 HAD hydrolase-like protein [Alsobacter ponti]